MNREGDVILIYYQDQPAGYARIEAIRPDVKKDWYPALEKFITGAPVVAAVVEGLEAIRVVREMLGATSGLKAAAGTIRGDYSSSRQMNLVHGSDGPDAAKREIGLYFREEELCPWSPTLAPWLRASDEQ